MHTQNLLKSDLKTLMYNNLNDMETIYKLIRENIKGLVPYSTARDDCKMKMDICLDANESPYENGINRYPSPKQDELKKAIGILKKNSPDNIFLGNGSDEAIDLVYRIFCDPCKSSAVIVSPSYGMYSVAAKINDVRIIESYLNERFELDADSVLADIEDDTKVVFICSPNNPSGNLLNGDEIIKIIEKFDGIVVVDEAYIDFADNQSFSSLIDKYPNLIVLQTLSKAWGMAGLRIGIAIANKYVIDVFNKVKYPYNISVLNQQKALEVLRNCLETFNRIEQIKDERDKLTAELSELDEVCEVFPSDANFILVRFKDAESIFNYLKDNGIIVRNRSSIKYCNNCLRISVGTPQENETLLSALKKTCIASEESESIENSGIADTGTIGRTAKYVRNTKETSIQVSVDLNRFYPPFVSTGMNFLNHMLEQIAWHGGIGLRIVADGDLAVDDHHTVEDTAIALGTALLTALGNKAGIGRYGFSLPMDEAQATVLLDLGGRIDFKWEAEFSGNYIGDVNSQMFKHFFKSLAENLKCNIHIKANGENDHHIIEGIFKAFARALKQAVKVYADGMEPASSKGCL